MKKIIFFLPDLKLGGAQKTFINITEYLTENYSKDYEIYLMVLNLKYDKFHQVKENVNIINLESNRTLFSFYSFYKQIKKIKPQVIISTTVQLNLLIIIFKILKFFKKTKFIIRESNPTFLRTDLSKLFKILIKYIYKFADKIICLSDYVYENTKFNVNICDSKIIRIYNPINIKDFTNKKVVKYNDNSNNFNLLFVGRLSKQKNPKLFIDTLLKLNFDKFTATIVGDGEYYSYLLGYIKNNNLSGKINIVRSTNKIQKYYNQADILVLTSRWEGFGHVIIESIASGTPVIALDCPGSINELVKDDYGWIVSGNNSAKIANLINHIKLNKLYLDKPSNYKDFINQFDTNKITQSYLDLFNNII